MKTQNAYYLIPKLDRSYLSFDTTSLPNNNKYAVVGLANALKPGSMILEKPTTSSIFRWF